MLRYCLALFITDFCLQLTASILETVPSTAENYNFISFHLIINQTEQRWLQNLEGKTAIFDERKMMVSYNLSLLVNS